MRLRDMEPSKITEELRAELAMQILMETFEPRLWQLESYFFHPDYLIAVEVVTHNLL